MQRNLQSVAQFVASGPFTEAQLRWFIFNESTNGLRDAGAVVRIGRRIYIDTDGFDRWITAQNAHAVSA
jgi:hypothetical protein